MRKFYFLFLINYLLLVGNLYSKYNETFLIKRVFLDTIKVPPTIEEIEWFCVYEINGYDSAVNWLVNHKDCILNQPKEDIKKRLTSLEYKTFERIPMSQEEIDKSILYLNGFGKDTTPNAFNVYLAYKKMIESALKCTYNDDDAIDYIANMLMCRNTSANELNMLKRLYNLTNSWQLIVNTILSFEDARTR